MSDIQMVFSFLHQNMKNKIKDGTVIMIEVYIEVYVYIL